MPVERGFDSVNYGIMAIDSYIPVIVRDAISRAIRLKERRYVSPVKECSQGKNMLLVARVFSSPVIGLKTLSARMTTNRTTSAQNERSSKL